MKTEVKIAAFAVGFGLLFWGIDAVLDFLFFYEDSLIALLITDVPAHEVYIRLSVFALFVMFGGVTILLMAQQKHTKAALQENQRRLTTLMNNLPGMAYRCQNDTLWTMEFISDGCRTLTGYRTAELIGNAVISFADLIHPEDRQMVQDTIQEALQHRHPFQLTYRITAASGEGKWVWEQGQGILDENNDVIALEGFITDITDQVQAEKTLRESKERYQLLVDTSPYGIAIHQDGKLVFVNQSALHLLGASSSSQLIGKPIQGFICPQGWEAAQDRIQRMLRGETGLYPVEDCYVRLDGSHVLVEVIAAPFTYQGRPAIQVIAQDITERKQAEAERARLTAQIREQARQMEHILATVPTGVLLLDGEARVLQVNPMATEELAYLTNARVGDSLTHLGDQPLEELLTSPPTKGLWHEVQMGKKTFEVIARPVANGPEPEQWVLVINDVTREREIRTQLQQQERLAAVGQLAAGIAHDFNNILAVILLYTEMGLADPGLSDKLRQRLQTIIQQGQRASDLIQQILDFSRRAVLERRPIDLAPFMEEVVRLLKRTIPENIKVTLDVDNNDYMVNADPARVQQAMINLAFNARDAMPQGGELYITLSGVTATEKIQCVTCGQVVNGEWVRIAVADTGSGIASDVLAHIFDPFFTTKEVGRGTGLGLAQVYGIAKQHDGHVDVTTEVDVGTTFILYLPSFVAQSSLVSRAETPIKIQGEGETILVVEDETILRATLQDTLELLNYRVLAAENGRLALEILAQHDEVALVLSDLVMPEMGGQALFHAMRRRGLTQPVVMLSGHPMEEELEKLQAQGVAGWLLKPPGLEQLAQVLATALRG